MSIERRLCAMKQVYDAGIRTVCFIAPVFPGITDFKAIFHRVKNQCDLVWLENLNLRGGFKQEILDYIHENVSTLDQLVSGHLSKGVIGAISVTLSSKQSSWRSKMAVPLWITNCPMAWRSRATR